MHTNVLVSLTFLFQWWYKTNRVEAGVLFCFSLLLQFYLTAQDTFLLNKLVESSFSFLPPTTSKNKQFCPRKQGAAETTHLLIWRWVAWKIERRQCPVYIETGPLLQQLSLRPQKTWYQKAECTRDSGSQAPAPKAIGIWSAAAARPSPGPSIWGRTCDWAPGCGGEALNPGNTEHNGGPTISEHPVMMPVTTVIPVIARYQESWRHKQWWCQTETPLTPDVRTRDTSGWGDRGWIVLILQ